MTNGEKFKTAKERAEAFFGYRAMAIHIDNTAGAIIADFCAWLDLEAEEEKPLPCPFCGIDVYVHRVDADDYICQCQSCSYVSTNQYTKDRAIAAHNRVAKKCMEVKE